MSLDLGFAFQVQVPVATAGCYQGAVKAFERADTDTFPVEGRALASAGDEFFLANRVYHDSMFDLALVQASNRDAKMG